MNPDQETTTSQFIRSPGHYGPPENELPFVLATPDLVWYGDGAAIAVPSLSVYTTGIELLILGRGARAEEVNRAREVSKALQRALLVSGHHVGLLGGQNEGSSFTYRSWLSFRPSSTNRDLVFELDWPGIAPAGHLIPAATIGDAISRVTTLWPS